MIYKSKGLKDIMLHDFNKMKNSQERHDLLKNKNEKNLLYQVK